MRDGNRFTGRLVCFFIFFFPMVLIPQPTKHHHFQSKEKLVAACFRNQIENFLFHIYNKKEYLLLPLINIEIMILYDHARAIQNPNN